MMSIVSYQVAIQIDFMTTCGATRDVEFGIMTKISFQIHH